MTRSGGLSASDKPKPSPFEAEREANRRAALNALKRARRAADNAGIPLSDWEGEFIESVAERIQIHGRAFGDPELGRPGQALSSMQGRKLKEITKKANGEEPRRRWGKRRRNPRRGYDSLSREEPTVTVHAMKLSPDAATALPEAVREALGLRDGDGLAFRVENGKVTLGRIPSDDELFMLASVESFAKDWLSPEDCEAFDDL